MTTAQRLSRTISTSGGARVNGQAIQARAPHLAVLSEGLGCRDLAALFNLKCRPGYYNAAEKTALLRRAKTGPRDELLVDFSRPDVEVELRASGVLLAGGAWHGQASAAGENLIAQGPWKEVVWRREKACDYLEIELPLSHGWKLRRQMLLVRDDRFLFLADALLGPAAGPVELRHAHSLPLATGASVEAQRQTREGYVAVDKRRRLGLVPPALPEWRAEFCHAELAAGGDRLVLSQAALGQNLYVPLWIDLDPRRLNRPHTWRRLTVGENLSIVPRDSAVGYRIQAGRQQWLIYRSLAPPKSRSVLGYNTLASFVCLRILAEAKTEEILVIE